MHMAPSSEERCASIYRRVPAPAKLNHRLNESHFSPIIPVDCILAICKLFSNVDRDLLASNKGLSVSGKVRFDSKILAAMYQFSINTFIKLAQFISQFKKQANRLVCKTIIIASKQFVKTSSVLPSFVFVFFSQN